MSGRYTIVAATPPGPDQSTPVGRWYPCTSIAQSYGAYNRWAGDKGGKEFYRYRLALSHLSPL